MSSDQDDVFNSQQTDQVVEQPTNSQQSPLDDLVGEGKKYKTVEDLVAGFYHAQNHIATLEQEHEEYRGKMSEYEEQLKGNQAVLDALEQRNTPSEVPATTGTPDEEAVRKLVEQVVEQRTSASKEAENIEKANRRAMELYGDKAKEKVAEAARNLGVSVDFLRNTAKASPAAFEKLVSDNTQTNSSTARGASPSPSSVNTSSMPSGSETKNFAYYNKLRKGNPKMFKSVEVQKEMMQMRSKMGSEFFK